MTERVLHFDGPTLAPGWLWSDKFAGYDVRRCESCGGLQVWICNIWVDDSKHPCDCVAEQDDKNGANHE